MPQLSADKQKMLLLTFVLGSFAYTVPNVEVAPPLLADGCCQSDLQCVAQSGNGMAYCNYNPACVPYEMHGFCATHW